MKNALISVPGIANVGGWPLLQNFTHMFGGFKKKFQMTNLTMPNNFCFMKYTLKSVPGLADVGVLHGVGDSPRTPPVFL